MNLSQRNSLPYHISIKSYLSFTWSLIFLNLSMILPRDCCCKQIIQIQRHQIQVSPPTALINLITLIFASSDTYLRFAKIWEIESWNLLDIIKIDGNVWNLEGSGNLGQYYLDQNRSISCQPNDSNTGIFPKEPWADQRKRKEKKVKTSRSRGERRHWTSCWPRETSIHLKASSLSRKSKRLSPGGGESWPSIACFPGFLLRRRRAIRQGTTELK